MATALPVTNKITVNSTKSVSFRVKTATFGDGYTQTAADGINNKVDTWEVEWGALTLTQKNTVEATLDSVGASGVLTWTPMNESVSKKFRMSTDGYRRSLDGKLSNVYKITCKLVQVFDL